MEEVACPLCGGTRFKLMFDRLDHTHYVTNDRFRIVRCRRCGMVFVNPRPDPVEITKFYPTEFYDVGITPERLLDEKKVSLAAKARFADGMPPGDLLDVGAQKGEFMFWMQRLGWRVKGVEFSETPPNVFDLPIHYGRLATAPYASGSFDLITLWAVLEHVHDPVATLAAARRLLKPGGKVVALVPNFRSLPARLMRHDDVPRHLLMFTPATLGRAAAAAGLRLRRVVYSDDIFSGSTRGLLNFIIKRALGDSFDEILAQNRSPTRWEEFASTVRGKPSRVVSAVDRLDERLAPHLDALMRRVGCSFIMTGEMSAA